MEELTPRQILSRLVAFPTVSRDTNLPLIDWLDAYFSGHGIRTFRHWNEDRQKAALIAHAGPWQAGGVVLSGHSDVVPVDGQAWTSDPWTVTERDGRLYGRGTCDMKGYVALAIWALVRAQRAGVTRPLQLALSYDEETGCTGAPPMIRTMQEVVPKASAVIVGEPSRMGVITGHKGGVGFQVDVTGYEVHSSLLPEGVSAIMEAARLVHWVNERNDAVQAAPRSAVAQAFNPPFTTLHVGAIRGGTAHNITAAHCDFFVEMRVVPDESVDARAADFEAEALRLDAALKARRPEAGVQFRRAFQIPGLRPETDGAAERLARSLTGGNAAGVVSYGTEAGQFQDEGYSAVVCGPGDIAQAHQPDEYLEVAQFEAGHQFMARLVEQLR
ncbi:acetylornithine deacetylase [Neotabrizicola sp. VNH66]|uniref:acetylornithine deacetylase n=1 Tax=Neotabrizicola sp. VNH66 TaxID=3400918 RepID=UPI003C1083AC